MHAVDAFLLFVAPERFIHRATSLAISREFQTNDQLRAAFPGGTLPPERASEFESTVRAQVGSIRSSFARSIALTLFAMIVGAAVGFALRHAVGVPSKFLVYGLQGLGAAVILGATLAEAGRKIATWGGETLPEQINAAMFRGLYVLGTFLFLVSVVWDAT